jgi:hypothetical protein
VWREPDNDGAGAQDTYTEPDIMSPPNAYTLAAVSLTISVALAACGGSSDGPNGQKSGTGGGGGSAASSGGQGGVPGTQGGAAGGAGTGGGPGGVLCGRNTCGAGEYCCDTACGTCAPRGASCIRGCDAGALPLPACVTSADCRVAADTCTGCDCRALGPGGVVPACDGGGVQCALDPCVNTTADCANGICVAKKAVGAETTCTINADCVVLADNCTACDCRALAKGQSLPKCSGPGVDCKVDPCLNKTPACVNANCVAR